MGLFTDFLFSSGCPLIFRKSDHLCHVPSPARGRGLTSTNAGAISHHEVDRPCGPYTNHGHFYLRCSLRLHYGLGVDATPRQHPVTRRSDNGLFRLLWQTLAQSLEIVRGHLNPGLMGCQLPRRKGVW